MIIWYYVYARNIKNYKILFESIFVLIPGKNADIFKQLRGDRWSTVSSCTANLSNLELIPAFP